MHKSFCMAVRWPIRPRAWKLSGLLAPGLGRRRRGFDLLLGAAGPLLAVAAVVNLSLARARVALAHVETLQLIR